jgi:transposase-like protein
MYFWFDGIHVQARLEDAAQCLLVVVGATPEGKKEVVGLIDGVRESARSWRELVVDLKPFAIMMSLLILSSFPTSSNLPFAELNA